MSEIVALEVSPRPTIGTKSARRLRREGIVPGNVFGHKHDPQPIQVASDVLRACLAKGARVVDLSVDGKVEKALVSEVQWDTFSRHILHVDFMRVDPDERVTVNVPIFTRGTAPGVVAGGLLDILHHELSVECLAVEIPKELVIRIGSLQLGETIQVSDLTDIPLGVKILNSPETVILHMAQPRSAEETTDEGGPIEPELIGRKAGEDGADAKK